MSGFRDFQAISALAGSGKTYQLTNRYIALLALGVDPARIMAITFTRKAAGEIFDRIVTRLASAALSASKRDELEAQLRMQLDDAGFRLTATMAGAWLMKIMDAMAELRIGTIDSFFGMLLRAFALELGLPPRQEMLEGSALERAREEALAHAFAMLDRDEEGRASFLEAFKQVTEDEDRRVVDAIHDTIEKGYSNVLEVPDERNWGQREIIWKGFTPWWAGAGLDHGALRTRIDEFTRRYLEGASLPSGYIQAWQKVCGLLLDQKWKEALKTTLSQRLLEAHADLARGQAEIIFSSKSYKFTGADAADALSLIATPVRWILEYDLRATAGMWRLLDVYNTSFHAEMRMRGRLSFQDVPVLLGRMCAEDVKLDIDYRMDGRIDHWMIDEFQDTNLRQWEIIRRLADEVLQTTESDRSFFYVGDVKQAIYGWRGGESTLFHAVHAAYRKKFGDIKRLDTSWRSSPVVLKAVNEVFGRVAGVRCMAGEFADVAMRWQSVWEEHRAADKNLALPGRVEWHKIEDGIEVEGVKGRLFLAARIVQELVRKNAGSICVLVRSNAYGDRLAAVLRGLDISVRREAMPRLLDNPAISALLSMLRMADHPDDEFAWPHVRMTPLGDVLCTWSGGSKEANQIADRIRVRVAQAGVAGLLGEIIDVCRRSGLIDDAFTGLRLRQLLDLAAEFDRNAGAGPAEFARVAALSEASDPGADGRVVVMTMHKSKGLEFDAVVLPELQNHRSGWDAHDAGTLKIGGAVAGDIDLSAAHDDGRDTWVMQVPVKQVAEVDPVMSGFARQLKERRVMDELCLLYVAMTRARQGLYLISEELSENSTSLSAARFLGEALEPQAAELQEHYPGIPSVMRYAAGDPDWMTKRAATKPAGEKEEWVPLQTKDVKLPVASGLVPLRRLMVRTPSGEEKAESATTARVLFGTGASLASARGNILHDLFSRVEWHDEGVALRAIAEHEHEFGPCPDGIKEEFIAALSAPDILAAMRRPPGRVEVWREQAFECAEGGAWISGRMDRVVIVRNYAGHVVHATILDFKSDRVSDGHDVDALVLRYAPQIDLYRRVLSRLTGMAESTIEAAIILTQTKRVLGIR